MGRRKQQPVTNNEIVPADTSVEQRNDSVNLLTRNMEQMSQMLINLTQNMVTFTNTPSNPIPSTSRQMSQPIPPYDPSDELGSIGKYIRNLEQLRSINNWDEAMLIYIATSNLKGLARTWYNSQKKLDFTWDEWKDLLYTAFPEEVDYEKLLTKIVSRIKRPEEDMLTYFYEKMALMEAFNFEDKIMVNLLIGGLKDTHLQAAAKAGKHDTPSSLLQFLKTLKHEEVKSVHSFKSTPFKKKAAFKTHKPKARKEVKCFRCNVYGHIAPDCPRRTFARRSSQNNNRVMATSSNKVLSNKYFLHARVNGESVEVFVDFGSTVMTINESTANKLDIKYKDEIAFIRGYGGGVVRALGKTSKIEIVIDECKAALEFLVVPNKVQHIPVIVGQPFTELPGVIVYKTNEELKFFKK